MEDSQNWELVRERGFPVELYPYQKKSVEELGPIDRSGLYYAPGTGKTFTSLALAQFKIITKMIDAVLIIVPPVLLPNWSRNVAKLPGVSQTVYVGPPAKRKALDLDVDVLLVGIQIFKKDFATFAGWAAGRRVLVIVDEAQMLKNIGSDNFKKVRDFCRDQQVCLLTGTPVSVPLDAYAMIKLVSPSVYKTMHQFENIHVEERDFFKKPTKYRHLDLLHDNLMISAHRVLTEDVLQDLPEVTYTPIYYDLDPAHLRLYQRLADEQMVKLENGDKLDLTNVSALFNALSQVPANAEHFSEGAIQSTVLDLIDGVLDELDGQKLLIFTHYVMTTERIAAHLKAWKPAVLYGKTKNRQGEIDRFVEDPACKVFVVNLRAGGAGVDRLQEVCRNMLLIELPYRSAEFRQAVARLHRDGQKNAVHVRIAVANKTLNVRTWDALQHNDDLVAECVRSPKTLRSILKGE